MVIDTENLPSDSICDAIGEKFGNIPAEIPVLPWPASQDSETTVTWEDCVMIGPAVCALVEDTMPWEDSGVT